MKIGIKSGNITKNTFFFSGIKYVSEIAEIGLLISAGLRRSVNKTNFSKKPASSEIGLNQLYV
jgi:hypothetical protein